MNSPNRALNRYVLAVSAAGVSVFVFFSLQIARSAGVPWIAWVLLGLIVVGEFVVIRVPRHGEEDEITIASTFTFALLLIAGTGPAVIAQSIASLIADVRLRKAPYKAAFNLSQYAITLAMSGLTLHMLGYRTPVDGNVTLSAHDLIAFGGASCVYFLLNYGLTFVALALAQRLPIAAYLRRDLGFRATSESVLLALAPIFVVAYDHSLLMLPLIGFPMAAVFRGTVVSLENVRSKERFFSLVQSAGDVITIIDAHGTIGYCSPSVEGILGYRPERMIGQSIMVGMHPDDLPKTQHVLDEVLESAGREIQFEYRALDAEGRWLHLEATWTNLLENPNVGGIVVNARDISRRKTLEEQLSHQAFHDRLTGLANRALFEDRVEHALSRARRDAQPLAVLFLDVDDFKTINDSLGHIAGDSLLVEVSQRIQSCVRPGDTVARLGGDEFAILLEEPADLRTGADVSRRILAALEEPFGLHGREIFVGASIGIAASESGREHAVELLRNADVAMYSAKADGKGRHEVFRPSMHEAVLGRMELGSDLQRALDRNEFVLHYQPTVDLESGRVTGFEALVRWQHPERGLIMPNEFIPAAEETGAIVPLGAWVVREACARAAAWASEHGGERLTIGVNLSPRQLQDPDVTRVVRQALRESAIDPRRLVLEITESAMIRDLETSLGRLFELKSLGLRLAMDDFGTGYSSFSYLRRLPIDILKVDRSFVEGLGTRAQESAFAAAILTLAGELGLGTVAEGVERPEQVEELRALRCSMAQGFLFAPALTPGEVDTLLERGELALLHRSDGEGAPARVLRMHAARATGEHGQRIAAEGR
jgi:diguanylate cyclase (GGDEF)-like protein/PAS domain S-box-containing protein